MFMVLSSFTTKGGESSSIIARRSAGYPKNWKAADTDFTTNDMPETQISWPVWTRLATQERKKAEVS